jgi:peptide/nickel transport system substrate-binding protein
MAIQQFHVGEGLRSSPAGYILCIIICLLSFVITPVSAQPGLLIVEANLRGETGIGSLNPLLCDNPSCRRITELLFPDLLNVDPYTGLYQEATPERGLALSWDISGDTITYRLRQDRVWSDGTAITAYDVFYSYWALASEDFPAPYRQKLTGEVRAAAPLDDYTIAFVMNEPGCDAADLTNIPVLPAHVYEPDFAQSVQYRGRDIVPWFDDLPERDFSHITTHPANYEPQVTGGVFEFAERRYNEYIRLITPDGQQAFNYINIPEGTNRADMFLRGEINLLVNPPYERREDIRAGENVNLVQLPSEFSYSVVLNLADREDPQPAFDDEGNPVDQGQHPVFGDIRVRRALQMATDVQALIDATTEGDGTILASSQSPFSWAYHSELAPIPYDPIGAGRLLDEAGWKDVNRDGVRECVDCTTATPGRNLEFELLFPDTYGEGIVPTGELVSILSQQWAMIGVYPYTYPGDLQGQSFDSYLRVMPDNYYVPFDQRDLFSRASDTLLPGGRNLGSYFNPNFERLLNEANTVEDCAVEPRRELYHEMQAVLQEDQPAVWLFSPDDLIAWRGDIDQFQPFWDTVVSP